MQRPTRIPVLATVLLAFLVGLAQPALSAPRRDEWRDIKDKDIDRAVDEAIRYIYGKQKRDGGWPRGNGDAGEDRVTSFACFALLEAGQDWQSEKLRKGLDKLASINTKDTYTISVRVMALSQVVAANEDSEYRKTLEADVKWLTQRALGAWGYHGPERDGDNSCSQFALLALWEADRAGINVHSAIVSQAQRTWLSRQLRDGGWMYAGNANLNAPSTVNMTTAGIASLYLCQDVLLRTSGPYPFQRQLDRAWTRLEDGKEGLQKDFHKDGYRAFCVQRIGLASGRKFIGEIDWLAEGARKYAEPNPRGRNYRSRYGDVVRACFELIFLARGRVPLTFNKLSHGQAANWNFHRRSVARFTEFMRREYEMRMRWQVVQASDDVRLLLDAPILLIEGIEPLKFDEDTLAKLREYTLRGGTIVLLPTNNSPKFTESAKELLKSLYADQAKSAGAHYTLRELPGTHPIYTAQKDLGQAARALPAWGVSDGSRELALLITRDLAGMWQRRLTVGAGQLDHDMGANLFFYATGGNKMQTRMRPVFVGSDAKPRHTAKIAWVRHEGNWNTQPFALEALDQKLRAENFVTVDVTVGAELSNEGLKGHDLVWMTGTDEFTLSDDQQAALRRYLLGGGTLFINAVGGSREFTRSAQDMLRELFRPIRTARRTALTGNSPLMTGKAGDFRGPRISMEDLKLRRTNPLKKIMPNPDSPFEVYGRGERYFAILAANGIHDTLDGHTVHGALSYMPRAARDLAANVVLYGMLDQPDETPSPTTAPATSPATTQSAR